MLNDEVTEFQKHENFAVSGALTNTIARAKLRRKSQALAVLAESYMHVSWYLFRALVAMASVSQIFLSVFPAFNCILLFLQYICTCVY
jgi:hypothetical protein